MESFHRNVEVQLRLDSTFDSVYHVSGPPMFTHTHVALRKFIIYGDWSGLHLKK